MAPGILRLWEIMGDDVNGLRGSISNQMYQV
jgi:hypothetical protein